MLHVFQLLFHAKGLGINLPMLDLLQCSFYLGIICTYLSLGEHWKYSTVIPWTPMMDYCTQASHRSSVIVVHANAVILAMFKSDL